MDVIVFQNIAVRIELKQKQIITGLNLNLATTLVNSQIWIEAHDFRVYKNPLNQLTIQQDPHLSNQCTQYLMQKGRALARKNQEAVVPASEVLYWISLMTYVTNLYLILPSKLYL